MSRGGNVGVDDAVGGGADAMTRKQSRMEKMALPRPKIQMTKTATRIKPTASPTRKSPTVAGDADDGADAAAIVTVRTIWKRRVAGSKQRLQTAF